MAEREEKEAALAREQAQVARTKQLQKKATWALAVLAVVVAFGLGLGFWQYRNNLAQQAQLDHAQVNSLAQLSTVERKSGHWLGALRFAVRAARLDLLQDRNAVTARATLAATVAQSDWRLILAGHENSVRSAAFGPDGARIVTASWDKTARIWDARFAKMSAEDLLTETCKRLLLGFTNLTRDEILCLTLGCGIIRVPAGHHKPTEPFTMIRILAIAAILVALYPTTSSPADVTAMLGPAWSGTAGISAPYDAHKRNLRMTPRPGVIRSVCAAQYLRCDPNNDDCCPGLQCNVCDGRGYCECR